MLFVPVRHLLNLLGHFIQILPQLLLLDFAQPAFPQFVGEILNRLLRCFEVTLIQSIVQLFCRPLLDRFELIEFGLHLIGVTKNLFLPVDFLTNLVQLDQSLFFRLFVISIQLVDLFTQRFKIQLRIFKPCSLELFHFFF